MELHDRSVDPWGNVILSSKGLINLLMRGEALSSELSVLEDDNLKQFNRLCAELDHPDDQIQAYHEPMISVNESDEIRQNTWFIPDQYQNIDVREWLYSKCSTEEQIVRVIEELELYEEKNHIQLLRFLIFLVNDFRARKIVWGVGRGSSIASYVLYLIGIHRIDSMKYDLDIKEFLK